MINNQLSVPVKQFDLETRTFSFARRCRDFCKTLFTSIQSREYTAQLVRSSGSVAANYIEANEAISKKDFVLRLKICRKEAKESRLWLKLCEPPHNQEIEQKALEQEAFELVKIFNAIIEKIGN